MNSLERVGADTTVGGPADLRAAHGPVLDDHSGNFHQVRSKLSDAKGTRYIDFVRGLSPDYARVRRDILIGYAMLLVTCAASVLLAGAGVAAFIIAPASAILIGYWIAYLQLFLHEGAHYNLAPEKTESDRLCNAAIGWMVGTSVQKYRIVHFQHHRALGTVDDSEWSSCPLR